MPSTQSIAKQTFKYPDPLTIYSERRRERESDRSRLQKLDRRLSDARLAIFLLGAILAIASWGSGAISPGWVVAPVAGFIALVVGSDNTRRKLEDADRRVSFHAAGIDRLEGRWIGKGPAGDRFARDDHPYARDLDLFGAGGLFERIGTARTQAGQEALAGWLLSPAPIPEIQSRQEAVEDLRERIDLREDLSILGDRVEAGIHPATLVAWATATPKTGTTGLRLLMVALSVANFVGLGFWIVQGEPRWFLLAATVSGVLGLLLRSWVHSVIEGVDAKADELRLLAALLERLEREPIKAPWLLDLRRSMESAGDPPSHRIARLARLAGLIELRRNQIFAPLALLMFWSTQLAMAIESWRSQSGQSVAGWLRSVGRFEAACALASYAFERPKDPYPTFEEGGPAFEAEGIGHPLIPDDRRVGNDVSLGCSDSPRVMLISGSNMSGKSTLLRSVGINTVLAQAGAPVCAQSLRMSALMIGATLRVQDSLQEGKSRFYAEIVRLRQVVDLANQKTPLLFLLDEILHGTNSHDRRAGAEALVRGLAQRGAIGLVTTHDLALADIVDRLGVRAANVHFEDHLEGDTMIFDYVMRPGVVAKSNALALMRAVGLDV
jgi:MutS domain V